MKLCGPKLSLCCTILSVWGIIQLVFMGLFYYMEAVALLEDLPIDADTPPHSIDAFIKEAEAGYTQNSINCWIAACLYLITLVVSAQQFYVNSRSSVSM